MYHTRLINLSHHFKGTHKMISAQQLKDRISLVTKVKDQDRPSFAAYFMAPEQVNFGLYLYKGEEDDAWQLNSADEEEERQRKKEEEEKRQAEEDERRKKELESKMDKNLADYFMGYMK